MENSSDPRGLHKSGFRVVHLASRFCGNRRKKTKFKNDCENVTKLQNRNRKCVYRTKRVWETYIKLISLCALGKHMAFYLVGSKFNICPKVGRPKN